MLELAILGFVAEGVVHGYELRRRLTHLAGYARPVSDGSLYPAINRLVRAGFLDRRAEPGRAAAHRNTLSLTETGRAELRRRLREPADPEIADFTSFTVLLAFLRLLPDRASRDAVLRRRLDFLDRPGSFFYDGDEPLRENDMTDPYRRGMFTIAKAHSRAERAWLREILEE
ncbi:PadR family transcriptional regulator [Actinoplanes derwentensis]|uniref:DNA-binding transcriptional regulator, PadR family n=1 Tax=Actinoplanes derwentensis TaxID=113562 RepID=A0A1H2B8E3_9ACTN|nr:PadR family transcriptional regulator [Actinoplanes derwentensis]GID86427.1 PadR family transcriptional regulator [Actinoplanes derwentensis]SDT54056.1 DNA-binding transcriptional regulator, PadR family [Actinoplanes derwentensis]